jgi:beta-phosphoglucomutase family hydrolase
MVYEISPSIKGLIFDFDGTIVDSMPAHYLSWKEAFASFGADFTEEFCYTHAGLPLLSVVKSYNQKTGNHLPAQAVVEKKDACHVAYLPQTKTIPEVMNIIERYHGKLPMAVATGNSRRLTTPLMEMLGLKAYFKAIIFGEDVTHGKPHPESFLKAASAIHVSPDKCEVFEDGDPGIEAAIKAGMKVTDVRPWLTLDR